MNLTPMLEGETPAFPGGRPTERLSTAVRADSGSFQHPEPRNAQASRPEQPPDAAARPFVGPSGTFARALRAGLQETAAHTESARTREPARSTPCRRRGRLQYLLSIELPRRSEWII